MMEQGVECCIECGAQCGSHICDICKEQQEKQAAPLAAPQLKQFILGGNATFTLHNTLKGTHLTFKVQQSKQEKDLFFVKVLTGSDNEADYTYLGLIKNNIYWHGRKSRISRDAISARAFEWFWSNISRLPDGLQVMHNGRCGRCGRTLTVPESIASGFGPECIKMFR